MGRVGVVVLQNKVALLRAQDLVGKVVMAQIHQ
jgi:hypothetical protein